jgi:hypothetical protein
VWRQINLSYSEVATICSQLPRPLNSMALQEGIALIQAFCNTFYNPLSEMRGFLRNLIFWCPLGIFMSIFTLCRRLYTLHMQIYRQTFV